MRILIFSRSRSRTALPGDSMGNRFTLFLGPLLLFLMPLLLAAAPLRAQEAHISCASIATLPDEAMALYVGGVMDGIGLSFSIADATAQVLADRAATDGEKDLVEQMRALPQQYFDPGVAITRDDVVRAVIARCRAQPGLAVDSVFLDVVGKS